METNNINTENKNNKIILPLAITFMITTIVLGLILFNQKNSKDNTKNIVTSSTSSSQANSLSQSSVSVNTNSILSSSKPAEVVQQSSQSAISIANSLKPVAIQQPIQQQVKQKIYERGEIFPGLKFNYEGWSDPIVEKMPDGNFAVAVSKDGYKLSVKKVTVNTEDLGQSICASDIIQIDNNWTKASGSNWQTGGIIYLQNKFIKDEGYSIDGNKVKCLGAGINSAVNFATKSQYIVSLNKLNGEVGMSGEIISEIPTTETIADGLISSMEIY